MVIMSWRDTANYLAVSPFGGEARVFNSPGYLIVPHPRIIAPNISHPKHFGVNPKYINAVCAPSSNLQCY